MTNTTPLQQPRNWGRWIERPTSGEWPAHVRRVESSEDQTAGVLKMPREDHRSTATNRARFANEVGIMSRLNGRPGVLRLLDRDTQSQPGWFVTPEATLLAATLSDDSSLGDVVALIAPLAKALGELATEPEAIFHRDIKPQNMFVLEGSPVLGDFGLAPLPDEGSVQTTSGAKVGTTSFLAPEMRAYHPGTPAGPADVWSLGKSLFILARPDLGEFPPDGTNLAGRAPFSLFPAGGEAAASIEYLLEAATAYRPFDRPDMTEFYKELAAWQNEYPLGSVQRVPPTVGTSGFA